MTFMMGFNAISYMFFVLCLGYYLMSALQWYSYRFNRIIFHFHKPLWHLIFFILPCFLYYILGEYFYLYFYFCYLPLMIFWYKKLDKPLVFTSRVKRFFIFLLLFVIFVVGAKHFIVCSALDLIFPLALSLVLSYLCEKIIFIKYKNDAKKRINEAVDLRIIAITASYGKTSIKNFLYHILSQRFNCYKTPRSVNTLAGLILDINSALPKEAKIYIAEAGARQRGDIEEISDLLSPQIAIVGQIGAAHIEYFKTLESTEETKLELLSSRRLEKAFVYDAKTQDSRVEFYKDDLVFVEQSLEGIRFGLRINAEVEEFKSSILGAFNAINLTVCIKVALYLGMDIKSIREAILTLKSVEHRLQRSDVGGKIILDDSFNGNFEGMSSSYALAKTYSGRKVLITPGIVESSKEDNQRLAAIIDEVFDLVIITGSVNMEIYDKALKRVEKILLRDKSKLTQVLGESTRVGDLILFSNDAPTYM